MKARKNLEYCCYYHRERRNPYWDAFKKYAWMAEEAAIGQPFGGAKEFLAFVVEQIRRWNSHGYATDVARYIAFFDHCSLEEKLEVALKCSLGDALQFKKPRGRTVFESHSDAGFFTPYTVNMGVLLYFDGSVYVKNAVPEGCAFMQWFQDEPVSCDQMFFYVGKYKETADAAKALIKESWERISALPSKIDDFVCDGGFSHYKFLSKHFEGMIYGDSEESKAVDGFHNRVLDIFYRTDTPCNDWLETTTDVDVFVEKWTALLDEIDADETRAKVYEFVGSGRFAEDCRNLGFEMDIFERFYKHCGRGRKKESRKTPGDLIAECTDYRALGNAVFSQWRYYNHWAYDVKTEFATEWFRAAFKRLLELDNL